MSNIFYGRATDVSMQKHLKDSTVFIITVHTGYPHGMAAARRIHLLSQALNYADIFASVIHIDTAGGIEYSPDSAKGEFEGTKYEYACGNPRRSSKFIERRLCSLRGMMRTAYLITRGAFEHTLKTIIIYERNIYYNFPLHCLARALGIKVVYDVVEWPEALQVSNRLNKLEYAFYQKVSLRCASAIVAISSDIELRLRRYIQKKPIIMIPILENYKEQLIERHPTNGRLILSISGRYVDEITFVLRAFYETMKLFPNSKLIITGGLSQDELYRIAENQEEFSKLDWIDENIECVGYIPYDKLMALYSTAHGAIVSLLDDERSNSRLPTKIAVYTVSAIPLVIGNASDVSMYFEDMKNSYIYDPGDAVSLAKAICSLLESLEKAEKIGINGRIAAEVAFDYRSHAQKLASVTKT